LCCATVEALRPALKENRALDYSLTLGQIAKTQAAIRARLVSVERRPTLRLTQTVFSEQVERAVAGLAW
jgi:hypothetical protein